MFRDNIMNWNIPNPSRNPASGEPEMLNSFASSSSSAAKSPPKPRNKFTLSNDVLSHEIAPMKYEQDDLEIYPSRSSSPLSSWESSSSNSSLTKDKRSHHGSMENLHKPKNHRSTSRLHDLSNKAKEATEMNERLIEENMILLNNLKQNKNKVLGLKVTSAFAFEALRGQRKAVEEIKIAKRKKEEEAAARMILHNLLLNSWRNTKAELDGLLTDNSQLTKSMENLALQLRVVRHLQTADREKANEKSTEVERLKSEITFLQNDNEQSHTSIEKMENELNSLQANIQNLEETNKKFENEAVSLAESNKILEGTLDLTKNRNGELENVNLTLQEKATRLDKQFKELTKQNNHWQERARSFESESWELKMDIQSRDTKVKEMKEICDALREEKAKLIRMKSALKKQLDETKDKLEEANSEKDELICSLEKVNSTMNQQEEQIDGLQSSLENAKKEYSEIEKELLTYKLRNVKRRREWANTLYFFVNPFDAVRRSFAVQDNSRSRQYVKALPIAAAANSRKSI